MRTSPARLAGVGLFVIGTIVLFGIAVFLIGDRQMAFTKRFDIYTEFAKVTGLQAGAIVRVSGARAGEVIEITPPAEPAGKFRVRLRVSQELHQLVRSDSVASIETEGLVGGSYLAIAAGSAGAAEAPPLSTIAGKEPFELGDLLQQMNATVTKVNATIDQVSGQLEQTITAVNQTVVNANDLITGVADDVKKMAASGARVSSDIASLSTSVREGRGTVGRLFTDDTLYSHISGIAANAEAVTSDARAVVAQAREAISGVKNAQGPMVGLADNLRQTLEDARDAMSGFAENMDALRHNFLLRGFFNARGYFDLAQISPAEYRAGALMQRGRTVTRVWLESTRVFDPGSPDESPRLTMDGRRRLDAALAPYLDRIADGVLVVEGFEPGGSRDQQFVISRARAVAARDYLVSRFHLDNRSTGVMPLGAGPADGAPAEPWNGIALAFFLER
ncbi:MAG: MCE family protein [Acidobacteria bacterium]|nr:MCE family protein [Acidobacteriota bacterium]